MAASAVQAAPILVVAAFAEPTKPVVAAVAVVEQARLVAVVAVVEQATVAADFAVYFPAAQVVVASDSLCLLLPALPV